MASLVLGDDHVMFLDALSRVFTQHGHTVVAVAGSAAEMIAAVRRARPDACLIDRLQVGAEDAKFISHLRPASTSTTIVALSADPDAGAGRRALDAGASGYVHQSRGIGALISTLERVLRGEIVIDAPESAPSEPASR